MSVSINWPTGVIFIPRNDLTLIQSNPTEIRELNINDFRLTLKSLEDNPEGMPFPKTHKHNTEVTLGGVIYARTVQILSPYTVTFEDGQYAVNLVGANSNIADVTNVNQVSVRTFNSAGLQTVVSGSGVTEQDKNDIAGLVWQELINNHITAGTTGEALNNISAGASPEQIADAVWDEDLSGHTTAGTTGAILSNLEAMTTRILGLSQENFRFFGHVYDGDGNLTSANIRIYPTSTDVENNTNYTDAYRVLASYTGGKLSDYQVLKI